MGETMIQGIAVLIILGVFSWQDMKERKICVQWLLYFIFAGIACNLFFSYKTVAELCMGIVPGILLLLCSFISRGSIGEGDGLLLLAVGIYLGMKGTIQVLLFASVLSAISALFLCIFKKKGRNDRIPFVPFMLLGYIIELLLKRWI